MLNGWNGPEYAFNAVFPGGRVQTPKVRAFVDFLVERLDFDSTFMQTLCMQKARIEAEQPTGLLVCQASAGNIAIPPPVAVV